jgi:hydroxymethylpyrimidine pyrophosphatase-like HAD family hydrolase
MTKIALVVSDVDGTLVTHDKRLTDTAKAAVKKLEDAGIGFTITSSRPPVGMRFLVKPLGITLPIGPFNGSSMVDGDLKPIMQHLIPEAATKRAIEVLEDHGVDIWIFTNDEWVIKRDDGKYVPHERDTIQHEAVMVDDFSPYLAKACKIVGASAGLSAAGTLRGRDAEGAGRYGCRGTLAELLSRHHAAQSEQRHLRAGDGAAAGYLP